MVSESEGQYYCVIRASGGDTNYKNVRFCTCSNDNPKDMADKIPWYVL